MLALTHHLNETPGHPSFAALRRTRSPQVLQPGRWHSTRENGMRDFDRIVTEERGPTGKGLAWKLFSSS